MGLVPKIPMVKTDQANTGGRKKERCGLAMVVSSATW